MAKGALGRKVPKDFAHVDKYPLSAVPLKEAVPVPRPVVLGVNWYSNFDNPTQDSKGRFWVARNGRLTTLRGGHCVCVPHRLGLDPVAWWGWFNQGREGACVGYGSTRAMGLLNHLLYYPKWLWDQAKMIDDWPETQPGDDEGTSVRAAMDILATKGHVRWKTDYRADTVERRDAREGDLSQGIDVYRWATSAAEVLEVLMNRAYVGVGGVPFLNSWGRNYPRRTWLTLEVLDRLIAEDGEAAIITDK